MKPCYYCRKGIDDNSVVCPYCGQPQPKRKYKIVIILVAIIVVLILLVVLLLSLKKSFSENKEESINEIDINTQNLIEDSIVYNEASDSSNTSITNSIQNLSQIINPWGRYNVYQNITLTEGLQTHEQLAHNSSFETYFGSDVTPIDVKNLLLEIRTNNLLASRNDDLTTIGVCFISKDTDVIETEGIYNYRFDNLDESSFESLCFSTYFSQIVNKLRSGKTYSVNVPNTKIYDEQTSGKTGFEYDNNEDQTVLGSSGGYYKSGFIRLIYIYEN